MEEVKKIALRSNDDKEYKHFITLQRFPKEKMYLEYVRVKCYQKINWVSLMKTKTQLKIKDKTSTTDKTKTEDKVRLHQKLGLHPKLTLRLKIKIRIHLKLKL